MGFFKKVKKAVSHTVKHVVHDVTHPQDVIKTAVKGVSNIGKGVGSILHGDFKKGLGQIYGGAKNVLDPAHMVGEAHQLMRPITNPINDALSGAIKGITGHNVLGSHPLNAIGTAVASVFTGGAAGAVMGGASLAGAASAGLSALESAGGSILGAAASGLEHVGLNAAGTTVAGWATAADAAAASSMAASGSIAGQMGLTGVQATQMNVGAGITKAGQAMGDNFIGRAVAEYGSNMTGEVSSQLASGQTSNFLQHEATDWAKKQVGKQVGNYVQSKLAPQVQQAQPQPAVMPSQSGDADPYNLSGFSLQPMQFQQLQYAPTQSAPSQTDGVFAPVSSVPNTTQPQQFTAF